MSMQTAGFGVQVMPNINFVNGAELAGRAPGEAIAGFNSGIGAINAIQNTRQKSILAPIEQDQARARLAQIQAETDLNQANAPYRNALARIEIAKANQPVRQKQGESIVGAPEIGPNGQPTGRIHQVIQEHGIEYDPTTRTRTPYTAMSRPLVTADAHDLNNSLMDSRTAAADARKAALLISQQNADTNLKGVQNAFTIGTGRNTIAQERADTSKERAAQDSYFAIEGKDAMGNLALLPFSKKHGTAGTQISTGVKPKGPEDIFAVKPGDKTTDTKKVVPQNSLVKWYHENFGSSPVVDQPATALPNIPLSTAPVDPIDQHIDNSFDNLGSGPVQPGATQPSVVPKNKFQVIQIRP